MFGGDELVARLGPQVFDVVDEEGVGERLLDEENDLCTARCKASYYFSAYTRSASLGCC
jgi:hypothetical protein